MEAPHPVLTVITTPEGHTRLQSGSSPKMQNMRAPGQTDTPYWGGETAQAANVTGKLGQQRVWGKYKTFCQPFTVEKKVTCWSGEEDRKLQWQGCLHAELLELRGLLANSSTIRAGLSTIRVCNMTFKVMLQGYKQTSSPSFYVLVCIRRKQTSLLAQKDSYPPRGQTSAELIDLHPASQPRQVLELKQSRCPPNNRPLPGEFRGLTMLVSSLLFVLGSTWASSVPALPHSNTLWHQKALPPSLQDELSSRHLSTWLTENNSFCSSCRKSCFYFFSWRSCQSQSLAEMPQALLNPATGESQHVM